MIHLYKFIKFLVRNRLAAKINLSFKKHYEMLKRSEIRRQLIRV